MAPKIWLVTGSSRGLGRAIVEAALADGDHVVATARRPEQLDPLTASHPDTLLTFALDVTDSDTAERAVAAAVARFGRIDVVVNNAGYANLASVEDTTIDDFRAQVDTNLFGVVNVTKAVLPILRAQGTGHVITVGSVGGRLGTPGLGAYQAAKWAVNGFTEVLAREVGPLGVNVTTIEPGGMPTDWAGSSMTMPTPSPGYRDTVGPLADLFTNASTQALSDTGKVAAIIIRLARMPRPPRRLLLGSDAVSAAHAASQSTAEQDARWEQLSRSTDRDDATPPQRDPLGHAHNEPTTVVRRFIDEVINGRDLATLDQLWANDLQWHGGSMGEIHGLDAFRANLTANAANAFTDMRLDIRDVIASGDKVVVRFTNTGTQTGPFLGTPPSNQYAQWLGIGIYTITDGKIREAWFGEDILGMLLQLGTIKLPTTPPATTKPR